MRQIKSFAVLQTSKVMDVLYFLLGLLFVVFVVVIAPAPKGHGHRGLFVIALAPVFYGLPDSFSPPSSAGSTTPSPGESAVSNSRCRAKCNPKIYARGITDASGPASLSDEKWIANVVPLPFSVCTEILAPFNSR
jgi:hypothetical protein